MNEFSLKKEIIYWLAFFIKWIPGFTGCWLRNLFYGKSVGKNTLIWEGVTINGIENLLVGERVSINRSCILHAGGELTIEDDVLIGPKAIIYTQNHGHSNVEKKISEQGYTYKSVTIEKGAWIGAAAIILPGSRIGKGAIVGAGAVVNGVVQEMQVVAGNPFKVIKIRNKSSHELK